MLYLLDANVLITAHNTYYPIERIPEFWEWLYHHAVHGRIKMPVEMLEEIHKGRADSLLKWLSHPDKKAALLLDEEVEPDLVQDVVYNGYAPDLTDDQIEELGYDPFLIAYAKASVNRCVVTTEVSRPGKKRQNRKVPDVCDSLEVDWCDPFKLYRALDFRTSWAT